MSKPLTHKDGLGEVRHHFAVIPGHTQHRGCLESERVDWPQGSQAILVAQKQAGDQNTQPSSQEGSSREAEIIRVIPGTKGLLSTTKNRKEKKTRGN